MDIRFKNRELKRDRPILILRIVSSGTTIYSGLVCMVSTVKYEGTLTWMSLEVDVSFLFSVSLFFDCFF
jgi:hypothetical protein